MRESLLKKVLLTVVTLTVVGLMVGSNPLSIGQEAKTKKASKGRLPAYYADVVTESQRTQIYAIQDKYAKQVSDLQAQLNAVTSKRDAEIESLLNAEQKDKLKKARDEAAAKKKKANEEKKAADAKAKK